MILKEVPPPFIAGEAHALDLGLLEGVHGHGADKGDVDAKTAVDTGAGQADKDAEFGGRPLRVRSIAVAAVVIAIGFLDGEEL